MEEIAKPSIPKYERQVIFCTGERCAPETSEKVYHALKSKLRELKVDQKSVRRCQTRCFGICEGGPLMVVQPEGVWYHHLDEEKVLRIVDEHLIGGRPVKECVFHSNSD